MTNRTFFLFITCSLLFPLLSPAQIQRFTLDDTLRGTITPERAWWDLKFYKLDVRVDPEARSIAGSNEVHYEVLQPAQVLQIDLQPPLKIERVEQDGQTLDVQQAGRNAYFIQLKKTQKTGANEVVTVWYSGKPRPARMAPWDGGFSWAKDESGKPFVATSCQGLGASVWWPCKDHMYDEPDSQTIIVTVPAPLMDVSNGRLRRTTENSDGTRTFEWFVSNPINNYGVNVNIADYRHFDDTLHGAKGLLTLDYYVLPENLEKAKKQFQQVKGMLRAFEYWFGPYPFYEDGYKLVEVPYLGMEHQSSITYGNAYKNGYLGRDLSRTGWGLKWDFIIIHESGHEWFANNITYRDVADMWIHESFTNYSEGLYTEYFWGKEAGAEYIRGTRADIQNRSPIVGVYDVNVEGSSDMYSKGGNMLHTIRQIVDDDEKWRAILRGLNRDFYHQTVSGAQVEAYISEHSGKDLRKVFDQYLRQRNIPLLEYSIKNGTLRYRWIDCVEGFDMPVKVTLERGKFDFIYPTTGWQETRLRGVKKKQFKVDNNFYILTQEQP
ncbi:MAG: M1 family metallopeptidase [Lewinellaceae bacterium]|nr:M1 family metallopeptidase [Saprospiraceae bacterium]MCB9334342.1 M1 family metallopeptidase [Lewinellaceae bacterium]